MPKGVNVGGMVGHCAVRYHVMGERSLDEARRVIRCIVFQKPTTRWDTPGTLDPNK